MRKIVDFIKDENIWTLIFIIYVFLCFTPVILIYGLFHLFNSKDNLKNSDNFGRITTVGRLKT